jgi:hypothetical protein
MTTADTSPGSYNRDCLAGVSSLSIIVMMMSNRFEGRSAMKTIRSVVDHELSWSQHSAFKSEFELRFGGELVATLRLPRMIGTVGVAESGDGSWTFERIGFWKMRTVVKASGSTEELANYTSNAWKPGGVLQLPSGKRFTFWRSGWKGISEFRTEEGEPLFQVRYGGSFRVSASVRINRKALQIPELPWMVLLAFYMGVMARRDAAKHAAAAG